MGLKKGDAALSESMINVIALLLSFVLIVLVVRGIFAQSSENTYASSIEPIARDVVYAIDRTAALAGSQQTYYQLPEGVNVNLTVDNKIVTVIYDKGTASKTFSGLIHSGPYFFENPKGLCFVKNRDDRKITIVPRECICRFNDGVCDPACLLDFKCDPDCKTEEPDYFCSKYCAKSGDSSCDPDCYSNENDLICDTDCIQDGVEDGICDPDCANVNKTACDLDCFKRYNGTAGFEGVCDPACKPKDSDGDKFEDEADGICYSGCYEKMVGEALRMTSDGICDLDCNATNNVCDPDCNLDEDCEDKCALVGESCIALSCCTKDIPEVCCPGTKTCADASDITKPACCGNGECEVSPLVKDLLTLEGVQGVGFTLPAFSAVDSSLNWENSYTCPLDCTASQIKNKETQLIRTSDLVCDRTVDGICDQVDCLWRTGYTTGGWSNAGASDDYYYCDPDCSLHPGCPYVNDRKQTREGDGICLPVKDVPSFAVPPDNTSENLALELLAAGNCDPDCKGNTEICDPDCCQFNSAGPCASSPGCYCPVRVNKSDNFDKSPAFYDTDPTNWQNDKVYWTDGAIEICSESVIRYLDRRGWDIKQVEKDLLSPHPLGFAFDGSRYSTIRNSQGKCTPAEDGSFVQNASKTIEANEQYNLTDSTCCADSCGRCGSVDYVGPLCDGIGFCGDHAVAMLSILRTLGVPPYDVYATLSSSVNPQFRHAYVIYFCDPDLPDHLTLSACKGNEKKWLWFDATWHEIKPFEGTQWCDHMCIAYNDYGAYPQIDPSIYGFGGKVDDDTGYAFPQSGIRKLNCKVDPSCILNRENPKGMCQMIGVEKCVY
ncbi:MAG: transglutaminase family protein [Candidatus Aenigmarchaeota archaeon]|nr:transglutaminase family protein [Candidatus Aenigmarchaeota archaeon]